MDENDINQNGDKDEPASPKTVENAEKDDESENESSKENSKELPKISEESPTEFGSSPLNISLDISHSSSFDSDEISDGDNNYIYKFYIINIF